MGSNQRAKQRKAYALQVQSQKVALGLVERLTETNISKELFSKFIQHITPEQYDDVVVERSITHICGYPLCSKELKPTKKQTYWIRNNKVYDVEERTKFCCSKCFSFSNYVRKQVPSTLLWQRKKSKLTPIIIPETLNATIEPGDEVIFVPTIDTCGLEDDDETICAEKICAETICAETDVEIQSEEIKSSSNVKTEGIKLASKASLKSPRKLIFLEDPISIKKPPAQLLSSPLISVTSSSSLQVEYDIIRNWMTLDTRKFLKTNETSLEASEEESLSVKVNKLLNDRQTGVKDKSSLPEIKNIKINEDDICTTSVLNQDGEYPGQVEKFYNFEIKEKKINFSVGHENIILPSVDPCNHLIVRRRILFEKLTKSLQTKLASLSSIIPDLRRLIATFDLTSKNVFVAQNLALKVSVLLIILMHHEIVGVKCFVLRDDFQAIMKSLKIDMDQVSDFFQKEIAFTN